MSEETDLAVQFLAAASTTPSDQSQAESLRKHIRAQYLPWICPKTEIDRLSDLLHQAELAFRPTGEIIDIDDVAWIPGAICTPMFEPRLGLYPQARGWKELEAGSVQLRISEAKLGELLPGKRGDAELAERLDANVRDVSVTPPRQWLILDVEAQAGLPIDLSDRRIIVERMRALEHFDVAAAEGKLELLKKNLEMIFGKEALVEVGASIQDGDWLQWMCLSVTWRPTLSDSSADSLRKASALIVDTYDQILSREVDLSLTCQSSLEVLRLLGEIYFEGDRMC